MAVSKMDCFWFIEYFDTILIIYLVGAEATDPE